MPDQHLVQPGCGANTLALVQRSDPLLTQHSTLSTKHPPPSTPGTQHPPLTTQPLALNTQQPAASDSRSNQVPKEPGAQSWLLWESVALDTEH